MDKQLLQYPIGSIVLFRMQCKESQKFKQILIKIFKEKFIQKKYYGTDYFEGDKDEMIKEIHDYLYICNTNKNLNIDNIADNVANNVTDNSEDNL